MSYLDLPRLHFAGRFQADTSTVNNDVRHFDDARFVPSFQAEMEVVDEKIVEYNGYWNPQGTGAWRMVGCRITGAVLGTETFTRREQDPAVGLLLSGSEDRVAGKLVDLDPQQQMVSEIWGLAVRLQDERGTIALDSRFAVAPFCDLWLRQQQATEYLDQQLAAAYQSVLEGVEWGPLDSPVLAALRARSAEGLLSIRFNVFGYDRTPGAADYATGRVVGTIGPAAAAGPRRFVMGRHLVPALDPDPSLYPFVPANGVAGVQAVVDAAGRRVSADFGNALPIETSAGDFQDLGDLAFGVLADDQVAQGQTVAASAVELLGPIPYRDAGWYETTAGVMDFELSARSELLDHLAGRPLAVVGPDGDGYKVLTRETGDGLYLRADLFVQRLDPGASADVDLWASRYGEPLAATVTTAPTAGFMGGPGTGAKIEPPIPVPDVNVPADAIAFPPRLATDGAGHAVLTVTAKPTGPGCPRGYLDGQVYGIAYQLETLPPGYVSNPFDYVSVLAWDRYEPPEPLTWYGAIRPILLQYANLYPIMSRRLFDLADYQQVVANLAILRLSFSLPLDDPNSMPVTRDLSARKRQAILRWLDSTDPETGLPPRGEVPEAGEPEARAGTGAELRTATPPASGGDPGASVELAFNAPDPGSKVGFVRLAQAHRGAADPEEGSC
ncbi:MAG TPA: hypothetical protein VHQ65_17120 [Thermoanaerobaculia bacterium]|nr:hypothetical protein [Thermoanaerobaculia bacterium]